MTVTIRGLPHVFLIPGFRFCFFTTPLMTKTSLRRTLYTIVEPREARVVNHQDTPVVHARFMHYPLIFHYNVKGTLRFAVPV